MLVVTFKNCRHCYDVSNVLECPVGVIYVSNLPSISVISLINYISKVPVISQGQISVWNIVINGKNYAEYK